MPEEPNTTPDEIEELLRELKERAATAVQAQANGVPAPNKRKVDDFEVGREYFFERIRRVLGGERQSYLPQEGPGGLVAYGLFNLDKNPDAPKEIQVGDKPRVVRKAKLLSKQDQSIPVFVRRKRGQRWEYRGLYRFDELVSEVRAISNAESRSGRHGELAFVLRLVPDDADCSTA